MVSNWEFELSVCTGWGLFLEYSTGGYTLLGEIEVRKGDLMYAVCRNSVWVEIHGIQDVYDTEVRGREEGIEVCHWSLL